MTPLAAIADHFGKPISAESNLREDVFEDSLDPVELAMHLETTFGVALDDDDAEDCVTAGDLARLVDRLVAEKRRAA